MLPARLRARLAATAAEHLWIRAHEAATFLDLLIECRLLLLEPHAIVAQLLLTRRLTFFVLTLLVPRQRLRVFAQLLGSAAAFARQFSLERLNLAPLFVRVHVLAVVVLLVEARSNGFKRDRPAHLQS